jgi:hypothetical protein
VELENFKFLKKTLEYQQKVFIVFRGMGQSPKSININAHTKQAVSQFKISKF